MNLLTQSFYPSGGPSPQNMAQGFDAPPTLERSGSEHRRAVSLFFPEGEKTEMRGGAFFNGKEGRDDFRTHFLKMQQNQTIHLTQKVINEAITQSPL